MADVSKCIFLNENVWISLKIWLKFVPKVTIGNIPVLVQGTKPLSQPMIHNDTNQRWLVYRRIYASLGLKS